MDSQVNFDYARAYRHIDKLWKQKDHTSNIFAFVSKDVDQFVDQCVIALLEVPESIPIIACACDPILPELFARVTEKLFHNNNYLLFPYVLRVFGVLAAVSPYALEFAEHILSKTPFSSHSESIFVHNSPEMPECLMFVTALYRIITEDPHRFVRHVDLKYLWSMYTENHLKEYPCLWSTGSYIMAILMNRSELLADSWNSSFSDASVIGPYENAASVDYSFFTLLEAKRVTNLKRYMQQNTLIHNNSAHFEGHALHPDIVNVAGVLLARFKNSQDHGKLWSSSCFVSTKSSILSASSIAEVIKLKVPILLKGTAGSGKTFYIEEIARCFDRLDDLVRIHLGDQTDAKMLLGTYSTGKEAGTFEWKPGVLTTAIQKGRWVLVEDIDKAPTDILSVILPLLEKRELHISSRGETIPAHQNFRIFATMRVESDEIHRDLIGQRLWKEVSTITPSYDDLSEIIAGRFPLLTNLCPLFIRAWKTLNSIISDRQLLKLVPKNHLRSPSTRDLIKWAKRVYSMLLTKGISSAHEDLPSDIYNFIFADAVDCFAGYIPSGQGRAFVVRELGASLDIPSSRIDLLLSHHIPAFQNTSKTLEVGRGYVSKISSVNDSNKKIKSGFARTGHSLKLLEQLTVATSMAEPLLLVGETGTGKTTVVQYLAKLLGKKLVSINLSQQTETSDLLGGYKPIDSLMLAAPLKEEFDHLFDLTFSANKNERFLVLLNTCYVKQHWGNTVKMWKQAHKMARSTLLPTNSTNNEAPKKRRRVATESQQLLLEQWDAFLDEVSSFEAQTKHEHNSFLFSFVEGLLVKAVKRGDWVLLDEINLASSDTLECISDLIVENPRLNLQEKSESGVIKVHPSFRLFGCMNPSTDVGKRDLPAGLRSRFTELYVTSPDKDISDLLAIIDTSIKSLSVTDEWIGNDIAQLYLEAKALAEQNKIVDGAGQMPHYSVRTLSRILHYSVTIYPIYGLRRALYEGACMCFLTLLDKESENILHPIIVKYTIGKLKNMNSIISQIPLAPQDGHEYVQFKHYWLSKGQFEPTTQSNYIITPSVEKNLLNLARATAGRLFPVLIQGPTSSGKTSMINYLAKITGHKFVRINNHEHTDLQEYLGTYIADEKGRLKFQEGALVTAIRNGYWVVLDELNLAPTDVLEALNRLLDDNRELFIPETQKIVKPHPEFMLFATQNPPGLYGGRKMLSRAFRNRFLELHFDDIPENELETILRERCQIAPSYAKKIVDTYKQLALARQTTRVFEQKHSFATLRDLFRWAQREVIGYDQLALNGYMLLGERVRNIEERQVVKETIEKVMRVKLDVPSEYDKLANPDKLPDDKSLVWTKGMRRLLVLVKEALKNNEPILLVGETGSGKTTICQLLAEYASKQLYIVNAHQNTETGDLIGSQRPVRDRGNIQRRAIELIKSLLSKDVSDNDSFEMLVSSFKSFVQNSDSTDPQIAEIEKLLNKLNVLFEWNDGSLVKALKQGDFFLLDEISLADDSVLERLNSVLEPERALFLSEKGSVDAHVSAKDGFQFFATMNPGGDYGKKELSPALRNRFTEIWVPSMEDFDDVLQIVGSRLDKEVDRKYAKTIVEFAHWFAITYGNGNASSGVISLRDILSWVLFVNNLWKKMSISLCVFHGGCMVFIDSIGSNASAFLSRSESLLTEHRIGCIKKLSSLLGEDFESTYFEQCHPIIDSRSVTIGSFSLERKFVNDVSSFNLAAPTTARNAERVVRAMQMHRPVLLEGSPGVGKTSLVAALADMTGNPLTRINLSEQTDLIDLFGSDTPAEDKAAGEFTWKDAPFLRAMQRGEWVLLDEMNLASQSVLEGLNACLDHRGEAYIPELDQTFKCHPDFLVFAAQNPQYQGGGRKGLPKSFLNRFSVVYVDSLTMEDLQLIAKLLYPKIDDNDIQKLTQFVSSLEEQVSVKAMFGQIGSPFEFNLRDIIRWLALFHASFHNVGLSHGKAVFSDFFNSVIVGRFRTADDRSNALKLFESYFGPMEIRDTIHVVHDDYFQIGDIVVKRDTQKGAFYRKCQNLQCNSEALKFLVTAVEQSWPAIIVGPSSSGKTELIRYIANLYGAQLDEMPMNQDIDSTDLLGGFDQVDTAHQISDIMLKVNQFLDVYGEIILNSGQVTNMPFFSDFCDLQNFVRVTHVTGVSDLKEIHKILQILQSPADSMGIDLNDLLQDITVVINKLNQPQQVRFRWCDGTLIKAVEQGHWLVLDNANLCSPSVLDRLNSLLEPGGCLMVNECSLSNGEPRIVKPHPQFRLFLTVNPKYGELSRAMRNRGMELYLDILDTRVSTFDRAVLNLYSRQTTLSTDIGKLQLNDSMPLFPVSSTLRWSKFKNSYFGQLLDAVSSYNPSVSHAASALVRIFPISLIHVFESFLSTVSSCQLVSSSSLKILEELKGKLLIERGWGYDQMLLCCLKDAEIPTGVNQISASFVPTQPLDPMANTSFCRFLIGLSMHGGHLLLELLFTSSRIRQRLCGAYEHASTDGTYLEASAAVFRELPVKKKPSFDVFRVLQDLLKFSRKWLEVCCTSHQIDVHRILTESSTRTLLELQRISEDLLITVDVADINESELPVYGRLLDEWCLNCPTELHTESAKQCTSFFSGTHRSAALRMEEIWREYRGNYPLSASMWDLSGVLHDLAKRFDKICASFYEDSFESIELLRQAVITGINNCYLNKNTDAIEGFISKLEAGISNLEAKTSIMAKDRKNIFGKAFKSLALLVELRITTEESDLQILEKLAAYSNISTVHLAKYYMPDGLTRPYTPVLDTAFRDDSDGKLFVKESLLSNLLLALTDYQKIESDMLQTASKDLRNLSCYLFDEWQIASSGQFAASEKIFDSIMKDSPNSITDKSISSGFEQIGTDLCRFGTKMLGEFLPNFIYDPAIEEHVLYDRAKKLKQNSTEFRDSMAQILRVFYGDETCSLVSCLSSAADDITVTPPHTFRPKGSHMNALYNEMRSFVDAYLSSEKMESLLNEGSDEQRSQWQIITSRFISNLRSKFIYFKDITDIVIGFVLISKLGLALIDKRFQGNANTWYADPIVLTNPHFLLEKTASLENIDSDKHLLHILKSVSLNLRDCASESSTVFGLNKVMTRVFKHLYYKWSFARLQTEEKAAIQTTIYRDNTEHDIKAEVLKLFPDYEQIVDSSDDQNPSINNDDNSVELLDTYLSIFSNDSKESVSELVDEGVDVLPESISPFNVPGATLLSSIIIKLVKSLKRYNDSDETSVNFYHDSNPYETGKVVSLVESIKSDVVSLLNRWPDHYTLLNIKVSCSELLSYPVNTPLAKYLQKIEQILTFLVEWETYASKEVSLQNRVQGITDLIISWRKLELSTWPHLFDYEDKEVKKSFAKWWYYLYENLIHNVCQLSPGDDVDLVEIVKLLSVLMSNGTYGDFTLRLSLLKAFSAHAAALKQQYPQMSEVSSAIANVSEFYSQFQNRVSSLLDQRKRPFVKDLHEIMQLARWKDTNINALKESSRRSHEKLYKVVRKYRSLVNESVTNIVDSSDQSDGLHPSISANVFHYDEYPSIAGPLEFCKSLTVWSSRSTIISNPIQTSEKMRSISNDVLNSDLMSFDDLATNCKEEADKLRKETPTQLNKDTKKVISSLRMEKSELLTFVIKQLRHSGLRVTVKREILAKQAQTSLILAETHFVNCGKGDNYYWKILEMLPRIRSTIASSESDVPVQELQRGLAIGENLVHFLTMKKEGIWVFNPLANELKNLISSVQILCGSWDAGSSIIIGNNYGKQMENMKMILLKLPGLMDHCTNIIDSASFVKNNESGGHLVGIFTELRKHVSDYNVKFDRLSKSQSSGVIMQEWDAFYEDVRNHITGSVDSLKDVELNKSENLALEVFSTWIKSIDWHIETSKDMKSSDYSEIDQKINMKVEELAKSLLVVHQEVSKTIEEAVDMGDENWFVKAHDAMSFMTKRLHMNEILKRIKDLLSTISEMSAFNVDATKHSLALLASILPFLGEYLNLVRIIEHRAFSDFFINCKSGYLLLSSLYRLSTEGFCGPKEQSEEVDSNATKDGTGLGDGSGAKNNNEDVEEDEDLLEHAQTKNEDQNEEEDDDDAVSIEGDMNGELEDLKENYEEQESDDKKDEEENEEEEQIDDEVGNIDELDPNQMDEKMWDEQGDSGKEKETEQNVGSAEDDLQGIDNELEDNENEDSKETENDKDGQDGQDESQTDDEEGEVEEDVDMQEDKVEHNNTEDLEQNVPESEILDIEDDLKFESGNEMESEDDMNDEDEQEGQMESKMDEEINEDLENSENETMAEQEEASANIDEEAQISDEDNDTQPEKQDRDHEDAGNEEFEDVQEESHFENSSEEKNSAQDNMNEAIGNETSENAEQDTELGTTAKEETSVEGSGGAENENEEPQEDNGGNNAADRASDSREQQSSDDNTKQDLKNMVQQLGDAMQEYYRRHQEITEAAEINENVEESANVKPEEFQHVEDEKFADTQALGSSTNDQKQQLNDDMEIDEEDETIKEEKLVNEEDLNDDNPEVDAQGSKSFGSSLIGERKEKEEETGISSTVDNKNDIVDDELGTQNEEKISDIDKDLPVRSLEEARELWKTYDNNTQTLALSLCEQLRLILEPTQATKLRGDFKTGKRLNMKRIIPYIASQYKKDKIWLRRTKPSKRDYQIMISVDNSKSMAESNAVDLAFQTIAMVSKALVQLEAGQLAVERFGEDTRLIHPFNRPFSSEDGSELLRWFGFNEERTDMKKLLVKSLDQFAEARNNSRSESWQMQIIISDGICEDHESLRRLVRRANEEKIIIVFVVIDGINHGGSIFEMNQVQYDADESGNMSLTMKKYLDTFPFDYYIIIRDARELPMVMSSVLRQFFSQSGDL